MTALLIAFLLALAAALTARRLLIVVTIFGQSLSPALQHGDRVLVIRGLASRKLRRGDVVLIHPRRGRSSGRPEAGAGPDGRSFVKRVAGLPGDTLRTRLDELEPQERARQLPFHDGEGRRTWHVPPGHVFVRGDLPLGGNDSLTWGPVPLEAVLGRVVMRLARSEAPGGVEKGSPAVEEPR